MMEYKGYTAGPIDFDPEESTFSGTVAGLKDVIHFEGSTAKELARAFRESIDSYFELCAEASSATRVQRPLIRSFGIVCAVLLSQLLLGQENLGSKTVSETEARQHLGQASDPVYPPIAAAARVQGDVVISVLIDAKGHVTSEKVLSGPAMLQQAALDAVKKWQFTPFPEGGSPVPVTATLTIPFHLEQHGTQPSPEQEKAAQAWFPLSDKCRNALKTQNKEDALDLCKQALGMSLKAGDMTSSDQLGRLESLQLYGHALLLAGRAQEALEQENLAVEEAKKCVTDKEEEYAEPFFWRALVEAHLGDANSSLKDFQTAEETMRKAIVNLPDMKEHYSSYLAAILKQHAALLDLLGRPADAEKLREQAAAL